MGSFGLLIKRDLRKRTGQAVALFLLAILAGALLNTATLLSSSYVTNISDKAEQWRAPEALAVLSDRSYAETVGKVVGKDANVRQVEISPLWTAEADVAFGSQVLAGTVALFNLDSPRQLGDFSVMSQASEPVANPIWVPSVLLASGAYALGDPITFRTTRGETTFHIQAFIEDTYGGAPGMGLLMFGLPGDAFSMLKAPGFSAGGMVKVAASSSAAGTSALMNALATINQPVSMWMHGLDLVVGAAATSSSIIVAALIALTVILVLVTAVVQRFLLRNLVTDDMASIGVLRAAGFTTTTILASLVAASVAVTVLGAAVGVGVSYWLLPTLAQTFHKQSGISWQVQFSWSSLALSVAIAAAATLLVSAVAAWRVRHIRTLTALRGGIQGHSFKTTRLPLASTRGPLPMLLGIKASLRNLAQTLMVGLTMGTVTFVCLVGLNMTSALFGNPAQASRLLVGELEDVAAFANPTADMASLREGIAGLPGVQKAFFATTMGVSVEGYPSAVLIYDDPTATRTPQATLGRAPRHDNEIALGARLAEQLGVGINDTYRLDLGTGSAPFVVTGIASTARNMGNVIIITTAGFQRVAPGFEQRRVAVYADDPAAVASEITRAYGTSLSSVVNVKSNVDAQLGSFIAGVPILGTVVVVLTVGVTVLVVSLVVTATIVAARRELGIQKAVGFSHGQLASQLRWTLLGPVTVGTVVGVLLGAVGFRPLLTALLRRVGIITTDIAVEPALVVGVAVGVIVLAWLIAWLGTLRLRGISAYALASE